MVVELLLVGGCCPKWMQVDKTVGCGELCDGCCGLDSTFQASATVQCVMRASGADELRDNAV